MNRSIRIGIGYDLSRSVLGAKNRLWCSYRGASVSKELVDKFRFVIIFVVIEVLNKLVLYPQR